MSAKEKFFNYIKTRQDLILLGEYVNSSIGISAKCAICGNESSRNGGSWKPTPQSLMKGRGCYLCGYKKLAISKTKNLPKIIRQTKYQHIDKSTGKVFNAFVSKEQIIDGSKQCITKSEYWDRFPKLARIASRSGMIDDLFSDAPKKLSNGETIIHRLLTELGITFETQKRFPEVRDKLPLPYDFYVPEFKLLIEYQGEQHYQQSNNRHNSDLVRRDAIKVSLAPKLGMDLLTIDDLKSLSIEERVIKRLKKIKPDYLLNRTPLTTEQKSIYKTFGTYTEEELIAVAKCYTDMSDFRKNESSVYAIIKRKGLLEIATSHLTRKSRGEYSVEELKELATKYRFLKDFIENEKGAYLAIRRLKLNDEILGGLERVISPPINWTPEMCRTLFLEAGSVKTRFRELNRAAYATVLEKQWQEQVFKGAVRPRPTNSKGVIVSGNGLLDKRYSSLSEAARDLNLSLPEISNFISGKSNKPPGGYHFVTEGG
jgi:very-short-patch-repair endonuclease